MRWWWAVSAVAAEDHDRYRVAVCMVGQLRTVTERRVQENLVATMAGPLEADVFVFASRRHEIAHASGPGGCLSCGVSEGGGQVRRRGKWGSRREDASQSEIEALKRGPLGAYLVVFQVVEDGEAIVEASRLDRGRQLPTQTALRARCRLCLAAIQAREAETRVYDFVLRMRPDYVFDCTLPAPLKSDPVWYDRTRKWASTHRDYWELASRDVADALLGGVWRTGATDLIACRPYGPTEAASRVESCSYLALCDAGARVQSADRYFPNKADRIEARDRRRSAVVHPEPPDAPGTILRPCCAANATHKRLLLGPPTVVCDLERTPVLGAWFLASAKSPSAWTRLRRTLLHHMHPHCAEPLPELPPPVAPGDDDDDRPPSDDDDLALVYNRLPTRHDELRR